MVKLKPLIIPVFAGIKHHFKYPFNKFVVANEVHFSQIFQSTEGTLKPWESLKKSMCCLIGGSCSLECYLST